MLEAHKQSTAAAAQNAVKLVSGSNEAAFHERSSVCAPRGWGLETVAFQRQGQCPAGQIHETTRWPSEQVKLPITPFLPTTCLTSGRGRSREARRFPGARSGFLSVAGAPQIAFAFPYLES